MIFGKPSETTLVKEWSIGKLIGLTTSDSDAKASAAEFMKSAITDLEAGHFDTALMYNSKAITALASNSSLQNEARYCAQYKVALRLLVKLSLPQTSPKDSAFLSWILTSLCLKPQHRIISFRMAIKKNIQAGNYGAAYNLIQYFVQRVKPVDMDTMNARIAFCEQQNKINADERFSYEGFDYRHGQPLLFCAKTFELITKKSYLGCRICHVTLAPAASSVGAKCMICEMGSLELKFAL